MSCQLLWGPGKPPLFAFWRNTPRYPVLQRKWICSVKSMFISETYFCKIYSKDIPWNMIRGNICFKNCPKTSELWQNAQPTLWTSSHFLLDFHRLITITKFQSSLVFSSERLVTDVRVLREYALNNLRPITKPMHQCNLMVCILE